MKNLTVNQVCGICGNNEDRLIAVAEAIGSTIEQMFQGKHISTAPGA